MEVKTSKSRIGKENMQKVAMGIPIRTQDYAFSAKPVLLPDPGSQYQLLPSPANHYYKVRHSRVDSMIAKINKLGQRVDILAHGIREHVRLGPKLIETVKGKLCLGARILQLGGVDKIFNQKFDSINNFFCSRQSIKLDEALAA